MSPEHPNQREVVTARPRWCWLGVSLFALSSFLFGASSTANAAGCHYQQFQGVQTFEGGKDGRFAQFYLWSSGPVMRVYEGGRIVYYQVPTQTLPCKGPNCNGSEPTNTMKVVASPSTQRVTLDLVALNNSAGDGSASSERHSWDDDLVGNLRADSLFRPPRLL